jgi:hypothetical protein
MLSIVVQYVHLIVVHMLNAMLHRLFVNNKLPLFIYSPAYPAYPAYMSSYVHV